MSSYPQLPFRPSYLRESSSSSFLNHDQRGGAGDEGGGGSKRGGSVDITVVGGDDNSIDGGGNHERTKYHLQQQQQQRLVAMKDTRSFPVEATILPSAGHGKSLPESPSSSSSFMQQQHQPPPKPLGRKRSIANNLAQSAGHVRGLSRASFWKQTALQWRLLLLSVAIILLWLTSFNLCRRLVETGIWALPLEAVTESTSRAASSLERETNTYADCAQRFVSRCRLNLQQTVQSETDRARLVAEANDRIVEETRNRRVQCTKDVRGVGLMLNYITSAAQQPLDGLYTTLPPSTTLSQVPYCAPIADLVREQVALSEAQAALDDIERQGMANGLRSQAYYTSHDAQARAWRNESQTNISRASQRWADEGVQNPYANANPLEVAMTQTFACMPASSGASPPTACPTTPALTQSYGALSTMADELDFAVLSAKGKSDQVLAQSLPARTFLNRFYLVTQSIQGQDGISEIDRISSISNPPFVDASGVLSGGGSGALIETETAYLQANLVARDTRLRALQANAAGSTEANNAKSRILQFGSSVYAGYAPPPPSPELTQEAVWNTLRDEFREETSIELLRLRTRLTDDENQQQQALLQIANEAASQNATERNLEQQRLLDALSDNANAKAENLIRAAEPDPVTLFGYDDVDPKFLVSEWRHVLWLIEITDYTFRALHTMFLIFTYLRASSLISPLVDARPQFILDRANGNGGGGASGPSGRGGKCRVESNIYMQVTRVLLHPVSLVTMFLIALGVFSGLIVDLYQPLYSSFTEACVIPLDVGGSARASRRGVEPAFPTDGPPPSDLDEINNALDQREPTSRLDFVLRAWNRSNGTIITTNARSVALEAAWSKGNAVLGSGIDRLGVEREILTNEARAIFARRLVRAAEAFEAERSILVRDAEDYARFAQCIRGAAIDGAFSPGTIYRVTLNATSSLELTLRGSTSPCNVTGPGREPSLVQPIRAGLFNASNVVICDTSSSSLGICRGPNEARISADTHRSGCHVEYFAHSTILGFLFSFLVFVLVNVSRIVFVAGMKRVVAWQIARRAPDSATAFASEKGDGELNQFDEATPAAAPPTPAGGRNRGTNKTKPPKPAHSDGVNISYVDAINIDSPIDNAIKCTQSEWSSMNTIGPFSSSANPSFQHNRHSPPHSSSRLRNPPSPRRRLCFCFQGRDPNRYRRRNDSPPHFLGDLDMEHASDGMFRYTHFRKRIRAAYRKICFMGIMLMLIAVFINVPWLVMLLTVVRGLNI